jgi:hypothetical protein
VNYGPARDGWLSPLAVNVAHKHVADGYAVALICRWLPADDVPEGRARFDELLKRARADIAERSR